MPDITLSLTDDQYKAVKYFIQDPEAWIRHVLIHKANRCIDRIVTRESTYNPDKLSIEDKIQIVKDNVKSKTIQ